ncbi:MAG: hypothetical protein ABI740_06395 [Alphaproteobacteria bacterium]
MSIEQLGAWAQVVATVAVFISLGFVAWEMRMSTKVATATARHNLSQFARDIAQFNAEHADRLAKVQAPGVAAKDLTAGDQQFRFWNHVQTILHAETFFQHHKQGLIPHADWDAYRAFWDGYAATPGVADTWRQMRPSFAGDLAAWLDSRVAPHLPVKA